MRVVCAQCNNPIDTAGLSSGEELVCPTCGSTFRLASGETTATQDSAGRKLGRFELLETVGHGGFGTVFKARDQKLDRVVAIKIPRAENLAGAPRWTQWSNPSLTGD